MANCKKAYQINWLCLNQLPINCHEDKKKLLTTPHRGEIYQFCIWWMIHYCHNSSDQADLFFSWYWIPRIRPSKFARSIFWKKMFSNSQVLCTDKNSLEDPSRLVKRFLDLTCWEYRTSTELWRIKTCIIVSDYLELK